MATGGSIIALTLDGRAFSVEANANVQYTLGGFKNEVKITGSGKAIPIPKPIPWSVKGLNVTFDDLRDDLQYMQNLIDLQEFFPITITFVSNSIYQGGGMIVGDLQGNSKSAFVPISLMGEGVLSPQKLFAGEGDISVFAIS